MCKRCDWSIKNPLMMDYHDQEWGVPLHDDGKLFEFLVLEGFQAGLSWQIVLNKREAFRRAFDDFDPACIAAYNQDKLDGLAMDGSIIRNKAKLAACVSNARCFLEVQMEFGSFDNYIWGFTDYRPVINSWETMAAIPAQTPLSVRISDDLRKRGFKFVGPTVVYAHMQATGMVNDHLVHCFRYHQVNEMIQDTDRQ